MSRDILISLTVESTLPTGEVVHGLSLTFHKHCSKTQLRNITEKNIRNYDNDKMILQLYMWVMFLSLPN